MQEILDRKLLFVTGKGGVGKTTVAATLGVIAARQGLRTLVVEFGGQSRLAGMFGAGAPAPGSEQQLAPGLSALTIDPDKALLEWIQALGGRMSGRVLGSSGTFQYFAAAAPGAREVVSLVKIWKLAGGARGRRARGGADLVIVDAPATGHALGMLRSPETFANIARVGPIVRDTKAVRELLADPLRSAYVAVAQGTEMAVTETIELQDGLRDALGRTLSAVVANGLLPRRFSAPEMQRVAALAGGGALRDAAAHAAREVHARAGFQHAQVTRLRRRGFEVVPLPFVWRGELDLDAIEELAAKLERGLAR